MQFLRIDKTVHKSLQKLFSQADPGSAGTSAMPGRSETVACFWQVRIQLPFKFKCTVFSKGIYWQFAFQTYWKCVGIHLPYKFKFTDFKDWTCVIIHLPFKSTELAFQIYWNAWQSFQIYLYFCDFCDWKCLFCALTGTNSKLIYFLIAHQYLLKSTYFLMSACQ